VFKCPFYADPCMRNVASTTSRCGGLAVWRCMKGKFRPTSAALDNDSSIFKFYQQRLDKVKSWQTNLSRMIRKCRKSDAVCMDFLLFPLTL
jgi:hypothetical protein